MQLREFFTLKFVIAVSRFLPIVELSFVKFKSGSEGRCGDEAGFADHVDAIRKLAVALSLVERSWGSVHGFTAQTAHRCPNRLLIISSQILQSLPVVNLEFIRTHFMSGQAMSDWFDGVFKSTQALQNFFRHCVVHSDCSKSGVWFWDRLSFLGRWLVNLDEIWTSNLIWLLFDIFE